MANNDMDRVVPLGQLDDFKVAEGDPDVRGWEVLASDGHKIGEVDELLVDTAAMKVRYLDVDVDDGVIGDDRHVLIPIGYARLELDRDCVMVDGITAADLQGLPTYGQGPLTRDFENSVRDSFSRRGPASTSTGITEGMMGSGTLDTAGLDNTPGAGTGIGLGTNVHPNEPPAGEGMRAAGYDLDTGSTGSAPGTGSTAPGTGPQRDTGSPRTGLSDDLGVRARGDEHGGGLVSPTAVSTAGGAVPAGESPSGRSRGTDPSLSAGDTLGSGADRLSASGGTLAGSGNASGGPTTGAELGGTGRGGRGWESDDRLASGMTAGAGSQGPVAGMGTDRAPQGDMSHSTGLAGSDYLHNADEDFYASDAFDDGRFYGSRRGGAHSGDAGGGPQGGRSSGGTSSSEQETLRRGMGDPGGMTDSMGASEEDTHRLAQEGMERLREDHRNRGVGDAGHL